MAIAPFSPLVITINLFNCLENEIISSNFFASISVVISCSFAKVISNLVFTKFP